MAKPRMFFHQAIDKESETYRSEGWRGDEGGEEEEEEEEEAER